MGRDVDVAHRRVALGHDVDVGGQVLGGVCHGVEVPLHVWLQHALEVVADAHVEDHAGSLAEPAELVMQGVNQHPGAQVLIERLEHLEFLGPLDVVALVLDVDARFTDVEFIEGLDRLELDEPGSDQPRHDDVLRHLCMRPSGHAKRGIKVDAVLGEAETIVRTRDEERRTRHVEQRVLLLQLGEDPVRQLLHRDGVKTIRHSSPPLQLFGRSTAWRAAVRLVRRLWL